MTNHVFAESQGLSHQLVGVGVRIKQIGPVKVNVYGVGVYGSKGGVLAKVKSMKIRSAADVLDRLGKGPILSDGSIVLKLARDVKTETMAGALADAIKPRMGSADTSGLVKLKHILIEALPAGCLKNSELKFSCNPGTLGITVNGKYKGEVSSSALSKAFLATYCDAQGVSPTLRSDMASTIYGWTK